MSKKEKLLRKLCAIPAPKDFAWDDLLTLMERAGFTATCHGGSHYMFEHTSGYRFRMSKTHPSGILKPYQIRDAIQALRCVGEDGDS
ncbi:MAG TPA: type II toxin-antitoxin system HicA family toxin [Thiobacillaceae bacterium]|nr:type II toxin-antitoxin system HicA family toxin [Thiobacillaceae bacterium]